MDCSIAIGKELHGKKHCEDCYIAFVDFLGFSRMIQDDTNDEMLQRIRSVYYSCYNFEDASVFGEIKIRIFSDNIVFAIPSRIAGSANSLLRFVSMILRHGLKNGFKPRGAICQGRFYMDDIYVWGEGLVRAYNLESKVALYPRIIIDHAVVSQLNDNIRKEYVNKDRDGIEYVNYLKSSTKESDEDLMLLNKVITDIKDEIKEYEKDSCRNGKEICKLNWLLSFLIENQNRLS